MAALPFPRAEPVGWGSGFGVLWLCHTCHGRWERGGLRFLADLGGWGSGSGKLSANGSRLWEGAWEAEILLLLALKLPEMR